MIFFLLGGLTNQCHAQERAISKPDVYTVCALLELDLAKLNAKRVAISGVYNQGITGDKCRKTLVTDGWTWPNAITSFSRDDHRTDSSGGNASSMTFSEFIIWFERLSKEKPNARVRATFVGILQTREKYFQVKTNYGVSGNGFGHLGRFPAALEVEKVMDIELFNNE